MNRKIVGGAIGAMAALAVGSLVVLMAGMPTMPSFASVKSSYVSSDLFLMDRNGKPLHQLRKDLNERTLLWAAYPDIAPSMIQALFKSEDKNFSSHWGVDPLAVVVSAYQRNLKDSPRGASTITMQLAKMLRPQKKSWQGFSGKVRQVLAAIQLESKWSKQEILEAYLNLVSFRGELRGVSAASWMMFGKSAADLSQVDSTLLAVLIRSPNAEPALWERRACWQEPELCQALKDSLLRLSNQKTIAHNQQALHLAQRFVKEGRSGQVKTTLDRELQVYIQEQITSQVRRLQSQNVNDAAVIVIENSTGEVFAYVGGSAELSSAPYVDGVQAQRQAGSTLKPFLYATAFEKDLLKADSWLEDSAVDIVFDRGVYKPQNHDRHFYGWVMVKTALGSSLNVPAVKVFKLLNDDSFWEKLRALNFRNLEEPDHYGPALALGVADVTLEDLTQGYRTLAQQGFYSDLKFEPGQEVANAQEVFSVESAKAVTAILSDNQNRALGFGLDSALALPGAAVKTGTSKDMRDNWCVGMNDRFTVGVWVGNFNGEPMWNVMGVSGAAPIWKRTLMWLQDHYPTEVKLEQAKALSPSVPESYPGARILYPQDGMVLALDPAIPAGHQKMPLLIENTKKKDLYWKINEESKIRATDSHLWSPSLGRHHFVLYDGDNKVGEVSVLVK